MRASCAIAGVVVAAALLRRPRRRQPGRGPAQRARLRRRFSFPARGFASSRSSGPHPALPPPAAAAKKDGVRLGQPPGHSLRRLVPARRARLARGRRAVDRSRSRRRRRGRSSGVVGGSASRAPSPSTSSTRSTTASTSRTRRARKWRDVFVNVRPAAFAQVQGGKFKIPFGYERLTGPTESRFRVPDARQRRPHAGTRRSASWCTDGRSTASSATRSGIFEDDGEQPAGTRAGRAAARRASRPQEGRTWAGAGDRRAAAPHLSAGQVQQPGGRRRVHVTARSRRAGTTCRATRSSEESSSTGSTTRTGAAHALRPRAQLGDRAGLARRGVHRVAARRGRGRASETRGSSTTTSPTSRDAAGTSPARGW